MLPWRATVDYSGLPHLSLESHELLISASREVGLACGCAKYRSRRLRCAPSRPRYGFNQPSNRPESDSLITMQRAGLGFGSWRRDGLKSGG